LRAFHALIETGSVRDEGSRYEADRPAPLLAIPPSRHASLLARLDRLGPALARYNRVV
jgi:hypothetical protein